MGELHRINMNPDGSLNDPDAPSVQTRENYEANPVTGGAQIGHMKLQGEETVQRVQQGMDGAVEEAMQAAEARVAAFQEELDRLRAIATAGRPIDQKTLERLQHELNDTAITAVSAGMNVNDPALVNLRQHVEDISFSVRLNK